MHMFPGIHTSTNPHSNISLLAIYEFVIVVIIEICVRNYLNKLRSHQNREVRIEVLKTRGFQSRIHRLYILYMLVLY